MQIGSYKLSEDEVEVGFEGKEGYDSASQGGISVILDTTVTDELRLEGYARDIVRFVQDLRKEANYNVDDRIYLLVEAGEPVDAAVLAHADYMKRETLALELQDKGDFEWDCEKMVEVGGAEVKIAGRR